MHPTNLEDRRRAPVGVATRRALLVPVALGCALGCTQPVRMVQVVPVVHAHEVWEHYCVVRNDADAVSKIAMELGQERWELAAAGPGQAGTIWCFKRPHPKE